MPKPSTIINDPESVARYWSISRTPVPTYASPLTNMAATLVSEWSEKYPGWYDTFMESSQTEKDTTSNKKTKTSPEDDNFYDEDYGEEEMESEWFDHSTGKPKKTSSTKQNQSSSGVGGQTGTGWNMAGDILNTGSQLGYEYLKTKNPDDLSLQNEQSVAKMVGSIPGFWTKAAAATAAVSSAVTRELGNNTSAYSKDFADEAGINGFSRFANNFLSTVNNTVFGALRPFAKNVGKTKEVSDADKVSGAYSGAYKTYTASKGTGGAVFTHQNKAKNLINKGSKYALAMGESYRLNHPILESAGMNAQDISKVFSKKVSPIKTVSVGKNGMKLFDKDYLASLYLKTNSEENAGDIDFLKNGGVVGIDNNIIPEGALHAHKNNLEDINSELDHVTEKGIPVVVTDENGEYKQVAEIEKEELVLTNELTKIIEDLWKDGSDESILKAGKILAKELIENTQDNTGVFLDGNDTN